MNEKVKKILEEQMELLSELSHEKDTKREDIALYSLIMVGLVNVLRNNQDFDIEKIRKALASVNVDEFIQSLSSQRLDRTL